MTKEFLILCISIFTIGLHLTSCNSSDKKPEIDESNIITVSHEIDRAESQHLFDMNKYRRMVEKKIRNNIKIIAVANSQVARTTDWHRASDLLEMNLSLEKRMRDYNGEGKDEWELFKTEFNNDLIELDKSLNDF